MTVLKLHSESIQDTWLDAYGHLNEAYYLVPFTNTTWKLQDYFDIGVPYFEISSCAIYTVETHLRYLDEVKASSIVNIESIILGSDAKRIWFAHMMLVKNKLCATAEFMVLHYDTKQQKTTPMPEKVQINLQNAEISEKPQWISRKIGL